MISLPPPPPHFTCRLAAALALVLASSGHAQTAPAPGTPPAAEIVRLSPYTVQTDSDSSYGAVNSNSITQFSAALKNLPVSADIFDEAFMQDIAATSVESLIQNYSAGAGFAGMNAGSAASANQPGDAAPANTYTQLRGLATPTMQRDSLLFVGRPGNPGSTAGNFTSNFDVERVEVIAGPQSMLYDGGGPGGVINVVSKQARFGAPAFGTVTFRTDQYGSKYGTVDYGVSAGPFAARFDAINATTSTRRMNIGDRLSGEYLQLGWQAGNTTVRLTLEQTHDFHVYSDYTNLTSTGDAAFAPYNGQDLSYLLASGQTGILGGKLNWSNVDSLPGNLKGDKALDEFATLKVESRWTPWFSSQIAAGYSRFDDDVSNASYTFYSPGATANPLPGNWTVTSAGSVPEEDSDHPYLGKALRVSGLFTHRWFGLANKAQTTVGGDYVGIRGAIIPYDYYQADSNWNVITGGAGTAGLGRTLIPKTPWTVNDGPVQFPLFYPGAPRVTIGGVNYVRQYQNPINPALISPSNPLGTSIANGAAVTTNANLSDGIYAVDYSQWLDSRLDTMLGLRLQKLYDTTAEPLRTGLLTPAYLIDESKRLLFNAGADYHLLPWLSPYVALSNQANMPPNETTDPAGNVVGPAHSYGWEVGIKLANAADTVSGSISAYHTVAINQEFITSSTLSTDINPSGLNGKYSVGSGGSTAFSTNAKTSGIQALVTANPTHNWRLRFSAAFSDGTIGSTKAYPQLYNDQFHENGSGQITYADGAAVYVPAAFNSKALTVTSTTPGAIPLTAALISTPSSSYYAAPNLVNGQIGSGSAAAKVLAVVDPVHGSILTGATGLPISSIQLVTSQIPGVTIPGSIYVAQSGDATSGYPQYSANLTSLYQFSSGALKGFKIGGTALASWVSRSYYYYPQGIATGTSPNAAARTQFYLPTNSRFDLILGYSRKLRRAVFSTQLNVTNLFNHYEVVIFPNQITGYTSAAGLSANFNQQPRLYTWTNQISF
jgi:outer membrane receptor protein involved in Fe transport